MDEISFKHFLQELIDSATTGDVQKLLVQASYFEEMTLAQQLEAGNVARIHVSAKLFLNVYRVVLEKKLLARRNAVLRKLLREGLLSDETTLREALLMVPTDDSISVQFMTSCLEESGNQALYDMFMARVNGSQATTIEANTVLVANREQELAQIRKLSDEGGDESVAAMITNAGADVCHDIAVISKLSSLKTEASWKALIQYLGLPSAKVRGYASAKLEEVGPVCADILIAELAVAVSQPKPDKSISILTILKKVARREHIRALRKINRSMPDHVNMRVALYETLVRLDPDGTAPLLVDHLCDGVDDIAYSSASMLDGHCTESVIHGIENMLDSQFVSLKRLVEVVVFSKSKKLSSHLSANTSFFDELTRVCALDGMVEYARFFGLADSTVAVSTDPSTVWAIDDSVMILRMYDRFSVEAGVALKSFESAELAIAGMSAGHPQLIFVDLNMPGMNGIDFSLKMDEKGWGHIPRVLVTTQEDAGSDEMIKNGLFREIVLKPFTPEVLTKVVNRYL